jgi:hypothetical protein
MVVLTMVDAVSPIWWDKGGPVSHKVTNKASPTPLLPLGSQLQRAAGQLWSQGPLQYIWIYVQRP